MNADSQQLNLQSQLCLKLCCSCFAFLLLLAPAAAADDWPALPQESGVAEIPAQEWPQHPGPRSVRIRIVYPGGTLAGVAADTGVMLTLHYQFTNCLATRIICRPTTPSAPMIFQPQRGSGRTISSTSTCAGTLHNELRECLVTARHLAHDGVR